MPVPLLRMPTESDRLRLWAGGDSLAETLTVSLGRFAEQADLFETTTSYRVSSGMTRPDFFDWPAFLYKEAEERDLEVIVFMIGANDSQRIQNAEGDIFDRLTDEWRDEYRGRVAATMDLLAAPGRIVIWVGQPVMRESGYSERMADLNAIYESEAMARGAVFFVDTFAMFANAEGEYDRYLPDDDGDLVLVRQSDGIHFTLAGGDVLALAILALISAEAGFDLE